MSWSCRSVMRQNSSGASVPAIVTQYSITRTVRVDVNQLNNPDLPVAPDASGILANGNAATSSGTVVYKITFVDQTGVESNASQAVVAVDNSKAGAVYTGLAIGSNSAGPLLFAANFSAGTIEVFDQLRAGLSADHSQFYKDLSAPFFGANRPGSKVSQGTRDAFWLWSMTVGLKGAFDCIKAFSETDQTEDLKRFDIPTLIIHGDDDQIVPIADSALLSSKIVKGATLKVYPGAPHGLTFTHKEQFNADLLAFLRS